MTGTAPHNISANQPRDADVHRLDVAHVGDDAYTVEVRGHHIRGDQPIEAGGTDTAPTPTELFAASLATCVAFYAGRYLHRHDLPRSGLRVRAEFVMATDRPRPVSPPCASWSSHRQNSPSNAAPPFWPSPRTAPSTTHSTRTATGDRDRTGAMSGSVMTVISRAAVWRASRRGRPGGDGCGAACPAWRPCRRCR
ncbi:OsmC family protein [Streptomyces sp. NBC_01410]|uniref:OsmC family protein n=1 Tax=Streptomyces sp. NBC_01410 TaxID=2903856 RepID=UPI0032528668